MATPITTTGPSGLSLLQMIWKCIDWTDPNNPLLKTSGSGGGNVAVTSIAAGDNNIGNVDVVSLPALPAGTNLIGKVAQVSLASAPFGLVSGGVSNTAKALVSAVDDTRKTLSIWNNGTARVYMGTDNTVTTSNAPWFVDPGQIFHFEKSDGFARFQIHGIASTGTHEVRVCEGKE